MSTFQKQILGTIIGLGLFFLVGAAVVAYSLMGAAGALPEGDSAAGQPSSGQEAAASDSGSEVAAAADAEVPADVDLEAAIAAINKGGCIACHTIPDVPGAVGLVGPNLSNIGLDAATRIDGYSAVDYIHESIADPLAFTAAECPFGPCTPGTMPPMPQLTEDDITAIVNYLATLGVGTTAEADTASPEPSGDDAVVFAPTALEPIVGPVAPVEFVTAFNKGGCAGCHTIPGIPGATGLVGPDLTEIGLQAPERVASLDAEAYIRQSILEPNAVIAPNCPSGDCPSDVMLQSFAQSLNESDLNTIVQYLSALGTDQAFPLDELAGAVTALDASLPPESVLDPFEPLPKDPAADAQIALGKYLFFDPRLSNNNSLSCASCHQPDNAFSDGQALSQGYPSTQYFRNTPTLYNTVYRDFLYWDGRMDGNDMATLVRDHLTEAHFMSQDGRLMFERLNQVPAYVALYNDVYGGGPSFGRTLNAIAAYVHSLNSTTTPYDQYLAGDEEALLEDAQAGLELFEGKAGCAECHSGPLLSDGDFHNTGVATDPAIFDDPERAITYRRFLHVFGVPNFRNIAEDVGLYALTIDEADWGKFHTAPLREVGRTAPYMHNGSLATLEDVVRFYNEGGGPEQTAGLEALDLSDEEVDQLVAFLESLSSEPIPVEVPVLPDYQLRSLGGSN